MKKICFITETIFSLGGLQRVVTDLANVLSDEYDITILCNDVSYKKNKLYDLNDNIDVFIKQFYNKSFFCKMYFAILKFLNIQNNELLCKFYLKLLINTKEKKYIINYLNQFDYVITTNGFLTILIGSFIDKINSKTIAWQHNSYKAYFKTKGRQLWKMDKLFGITVPLFDDICVLTKSDKKDYDNKFNINSTVIYNGTKLNSLNKNFQYYEENYNKKTIIFAARIDIYVKGIDFLLDVFKKVILKNPEWRLMICGDGPDNQKMKNMIKDYLLENNVILKGHVKNMENAYKQSSIFISTSRVEGFGLGLIEAMSYGIPVVSFDTSGPKEIISDELDELLIPCYEEKIMVKKICNLINDKNYYVKMAENSNKRAYLFSLENMKKDWIKLLEE